MILGDFGKLSVKDLKKDFLIGCLAIICFSSTNMGSSAAARFARKKVE